MEKIDLSTNSKSIGALYNKVVRGDTASYGVFTVDNGVLDATSEGTGSLDDFVQEFEEAHVQFGLARVSVPGSDVFKNILLGWCPDSAPAKLRLSFAANFADVARVLPGYHIQITARDADDLDAEEMVARVCAAAGARYTAHTGAAAAPVPSKPAFKPTPSKPAAAKPAPSKPIASNAAAKPAISKPPAKPLPASSKAEDDGWGDEKEIEERDFEKTPLENVPSAYKPTKVNMDELRGQKSDTISSQPPAPKAAESKPKEGSKPEQSKPVSARADAFKSDGRLTSLPKPKVNNAVASRWTSAATSSADKPTFGSKPSFAAPHGTPAKKMPEGVFQNHGNENGLTPAQAWAQKRGKYKVDAAAQEAETEAAAAGGDKEDVAEKLSHISINKKPEVKEPEVEEPEVAEEPEEPEAEEEDESEEEDDKPVAEPTIIRPAASFPAPPKRNVAAEPAPTPSLPPRVPARQEEPPKEPEPVSEPAAEKSVSAIAQYDYEKDEDNEVAFEEGDEIVDIEFVDEEWWSGKNAKTGEVGLFPASYVSLKESEPESASAPAPAQVSTPAPASSGKSAIAEYDYEKEEDNEIGFSEGDLIVEIEFVDEEWWSGKHSVTGEVGVFPGNYVSLQESNSE